MGRARLGWTGGSGRRTAALIVAMLAPATVFAGGQAVAAARPGGAGAPRAAGQAAGTISTVAGGVGGPASGTKVALSPCDVAFAQGHLLIADVADTTNRDGAVREMSPGSSLLTTLAGTHAFGPLGDGGAATAASLNSCGVTADSFGNLVIASGGIRVVAKRTGTFYGQAMTAGDIYTVAGFGTSVQVDSAGNLVIAENSGFQIQVVAESTGTFYGQAMTAGNIYTVAGDGREGFSGDGGPATSAELELFSAKPGVTLPPSVAVDPAGNLVISDTGNFRVRVVADSTGTFYGQAMTAGDIYTVAGDGGQGFSGDGGPATSAAISPFGAAVDSAGNLVISDAGSCRVRVVAETTGRLYGQPMTAGDIYTVAGDGTCKFSGDGGPATSAGLFEPSAVAVDSAGNLVIADRRDSRVRVVAERHGTFYGKAMTVGDIYTIAGTGHGFGYSGDGGPATRAELGGTQGVAVSPAGNLVTGDTTNNHRFRVAAAISGTLYGIKMIAGNIYTVAGNGQVGFSGNGTLAIGAKLQGDGPVTVDPAGNLLIEDNLRIRVIAARAGTFYGRAMKAGAIYTVAGSGSVGFSGDGVPATSATMWPGGVALDPAGNLVIADHGNNRIRVVAERSGTFYGIKMIAGLIYTVAGNGEIEFSGDGGPATQASLWSPATVAVDPAGNLVIADTGNSRIRVVAKRTGTFYGQAMTAGDIYTVAGNGTVGFSGDGGPATSAEFNSLASTVVDPAGNLVIADSQNSRIRVVAETTGTFYGQAMTAGDIYTVAGNGAVGFSGDGGPAASAELHNPVAVATNAAGNILIADGKNGRIRMVTR